MQRATRYCSATCSVSPRNEGLEVTESVTAFTWLLVLSYHRAVVLSPPNAATL